MAQLIQVADSSCVSARDPEQGTRKVHSLPVPDQLTPRYNQETGKLKTHL